MLVGAIQIEKQSDPSVCNLSGLGQSQKLVISTEGRNLLCAPSMGAILEVQVLP